MSAVRATAAAEELEAEQVQLPAAEPVEPARPAAPAMPPFVPKHPVMAAVYVASSVLLGITQGLGLNLVTANLQNLQASFDATQLEMSWLPAAYFATNIAGTIFMFKVRTQFGMRGFAEVGILVFVASVFAHLLTKDLHSAIAVRAIMGVAAAPLSTLAFFYMLEWLPPAKKMSFGICFGMLGSNLALPLARLISPDLLQLGEWQGLYLLEVGLALLSLAVIYLVPITAPPRQKVFDRDDWVAFPLLLVATGGLVIVLSEGRAYWWFEAPWLGVLLAISIAAGAMLFLHELHRKNPIIDLRWLTSSDMLTFAGALLLFRLLLSEQSVGVTGLFTALNIQNEQLIPLFGVIGLATFLTTAVLTQIIKPQRTPMIHLAALAMIAVASWMDSNSTVLSRPEQFYLSQALIGCASALFLPPAMLTGFGKAMAKGPQYILSFLTVFLSTQSLGGLLGSAVFSTFVTIREQFHSNVLLENVTMLDPLVAQRVQQYGGAFARIMTDPTQRNYRGLTMLSQAATQQSYVLAYNDMFLLIAVGAVAVAGLLLLHMLVGALKKPAPAPAA